MARVRSKKMIPEYDIQRVFHQWVSQQDKMLGHSVPNGLLSNGEAIAKEKLIGLTSGVPDYNVDIIGETLRIEFKTSAGKLSKSQIEIICKLVKLKRPVRVCRSPKEAIKFVRYWQNKLGVA